VRAEARAAVIVASSGMCQGGRIVGHLAARLPDPRTHVVFVGFQAQGTLGRRLVDGARRVRVAGREVEVRARVHTIGGFSAHGGRSEMLAWVRAVSPPPRRVFVVHGEPRVQESFAVALRAEAGIRDVAIPRHGEAFDL
jgi:metallo-beta-lactamase family protein